MSTTFTLPIVAYVSLKITLRTENSMIPHKAVMYINATRNDVSGIQKHIMNPDI